MGKTPEYTKKAIDNYREKFDFIQVRFPKGTKERIKSTETESVNSYIIKCVLDSLEKYVPEEKEEPKKKEINLSELQKQLDQLRQGCNENK